ncbi:ECF transporter S component [Ruminococcaceae bacterium OttesenSCG-928-O06]|nr:ECF transporter S component [Ruminococcaceae bacterium OttesenSCG-928-O06]
MNVRRKTYFLTQFSIMLAIEAVFCFTPLGSLPALGPIVMTMAHIPVIFTAILLGTGAGTLMGAFAGLFSFIVWTFMPPNPMIAFAFTPVFPPGNAFSLLITFVPRILVGTVSGLIYHRCKKIGKNKEWLWAGIAAVLGTAMNTAGVLGGIALFFGDAYAGALGAVLSFIIRYTVLTSGVPEAVLAALAAVLICMPIKRALVQRK